MDRYDERAPINVWVGNLGKYNEGELVGYWLSLPQPDFDETWEKLMGEIGIDYERYEEVFCADWECRIPGLKYSEYPDYEELNSIAEQWEDLNDEEMGVVEVYMDKVSDDIEDAMCCESVVHYGCDDMTDVAYRYCNDCGMFDGVSDFISSYFDFAAYGRDMESEGTFGYSETLGCMVEIIR